MALFLMPHLEVLPPPQRRLWDELRQVPEEFTLYDGTALALRLGHGVPALRRLEEPDVVAANGLRLATLLDLAGTKASVVQVRGEAKDYLDIDALMTAGVSLPRALAAAKAIYGPSFNPQITLKALSYFEDGNLTRLPDEVKNRLAAAARDVDLDRLPEIAIPRERSGHEP